METVVPRSKNGWPLKWCHNCKDTEEVIVYGEQVFLCLGCREWIDYDRHLQQVPEIDNEY